MRDVLPSLGAANMPKFFHRSCISLALDAIRTSSPFVALCTNQSNNRQLSRRRALLSYLALGCLVAIGPQASRLLAQSEASSDWSVEWAWSEGEVDAAGTNFWPQYRGPRGDGRAYLTADPPIQWSESQNVFWKLPIPGKAWSSPVVWGDRVWLTNATEDGKSMSVLCIDLFKGNILWNVEVFQNETVQPDYHEFNSYASSTPVLDSENVYAHFGAYGTACLNRLTGEVRWTRRDLPCNHYRGAGSSPILYRDLLIFNMDGYDQQYVVALDKNSGETRWRSERDIDYATDDGDQKKGFGTPHIVEVEGEAGQSLQLISPAAKAIVAYSPDTGNELWKVHYSEHSAAARPLFDGQSIFTTTGFGRAKLLAIDPKGSGDVTGERVKWTASRTIGAKPSPVLIGDRLYSVEDRGVLSAIDKSDGRTLWQKRLGGDFSSSPVEAAGRIYCFDEQGKCHVVDLEGNVLAENKLDTGCLASPVCVGKILLVRTRDALYAIRE